MPLLPQDEAHLKRALTLAREASGQASPNPAVGCVLAMGGETLGEGAHIYENRDHAEIVALKEAATRGRNVRGATAYVTLEPCSHHGRTGPCADALIAAEIARCVVATVDPNPLVRGNGMEKLRLAGVGVVLARGGLEREARELNDAFAWSIQHGLPFVTLKAALSVDGMLAPPSQQRLGAMPFWLTGEAARLDVQKLRHASDAILTGIGTILADDPLLNDRTGLPRRRPLLRIVLDSQLRTPLDSQIVRSAASDVLVLCSETASAERMQDLLALGVGVVAVPAKFGRLDVQAALEALRGRGLLSLLVEAGSAVNGSFLAAGLVDRVVLYYSETELGSGALPFAEGNASPYILQQQLGRVERCTFANGAGEDVRISGYLHDPWTGIE